MKFKDIIKNVDTSNPDRAWASIEELIEALNMDISPWGESWDREKFDASVKEFMLSPNYCTDTVVGWSVIMFNMVPVATCYQPARKSDKQIKFLSKELATELYEFIKSCHTPEPNTDWDIYTDEQLESEVGDGYRVIYASEVMSDVAIYNGKTYPVDRASLHVDYNTPNEEWRKIDLIVDGVKTRVNLDEIKFPYRIKSEITS